MNHIQNETNILLTEHLSQAFMHQSSAQIIWSVNTVDAINAEEDQYKGKIRVDINGINNIKLPFTITPQQAIDLGGPVSKLAPDNDYLFHCIGDTVTNEYLEFVTIYNEDTNKVLVKQLTNSFKGNNGSGFYVEPNSFESGGMPYREPLMRFNVVQKDVQQSVANYLSDFLQFDDFELDLPRHQTFINPQDKKSIDTLVDTLNQGINISKKLRQFIAELSNQELVKKPVDDDRPDINYVIENIKNGVELLEEDISSQSIFIKVSKIRSPQIKRMLGLSANSYFSSIDEILLRIKGHLTSYTSLTGAKNAELQSQHQEFCSVFVENLNLLESNLLSLSNAYESAIA